MIETKFTATQVAALEKIKVLFKEYAFTRKPSFLYSQKEILRLTERDLSKLDVDYVSKYQISDEIVKELAKEIYDTLMEKQDYDPRIVKPTSFSPGFRLGLDIRFMRCSNRRYNYY